MTDAAEAPDAHVFSATAAWDPAERAGDLKAEGSGFSSSFAGAPSLGGRADRTNPEELVLSALLACFVQTWSIFLAKLKLPVDHPVVDGTVGIEADPAGGYRLAGFRLFPHVPADLWRDRRAEVEKTFALAEKYCIVSKVLRGEGRTISVEAKSA